MACHATGANRDFSIVKEAVYGTTPTNPMFKTLRTTGDTLKGTIETQSSSELVKGRITSAPVMGRVSGGGDVPVEFSFRTFDDFLEALMFAKWEDVAQFEGVALAAGSKMLRLGTKANPGEAQSFTVERYFSDIGMWEYFVGVLVNTFKLNIPLDGKVTATFGLIAKNNGSPVTAMLAGETYDPEFPTITDQFTSFVGKLLVKSGLTGNFDLVNDAIAYATAIDISVNNNMQSDNVVFSKEASCVTPGQFGVTGNLTVYLKGKNFIDYVNQWTSVKVFFDITDTSGDTFRFVLGALKFTDAPDGVNGPNAVTVQHPFTAFGADALTIYKIPCAAENRCLAPIFSGTAKALAMTKHPEENSAATTEIRYTLDGTEPTSTSTLYTAAVDITAAGATPFPITVRAKVFDKRVTGALSVSREYKKVYAS